MSLSLLLATPRRLKHRRISKGPRVSIPGSKQQSRDLLTEPVASAVQRSINQEINPQYQHVRHGEQGIRRRSHQEHNGPLKAMLGEAAMVPADEDLTDLE